MKSKKLIPAFLIATILSSNSAFAMYQGGEDMGTPPEMTIELPDDWDEMTETEQQAWVEENRPEMPEGEEGEMGGMGRGGMNQVELPDDWDEMTETEQQAWVEENMPEPSEGGFGGVELPDDWDEMTEEEQQAWMEENRPEMEEMQNQKNTARNALRATNYSSYSGELEEDIEFSDEDEIENAEAVEFLQRRGILSGYSDGSFGPQNSISRAESLKVLLESTGEDLTDATESDFSDVSTDDWYFPYVETAYEEGFVSGYSDGTFHPNQTVSQAELLKIAFESFGINLTDYGVTDLPDNIDTTAWYALYLQYALDTGLLEKDDVDPSAGMTRDMFSQLIYLLIQQQEGLE